MDAIAAFLNNPLVLMAFSLICQFVPGVRTAIKNVLIPIIQILLAFLGHALAPEAANAASAMLPAVVGVHIASISFGFSGLLSGLGGAIATAAQAYILQRMTCWPDRHPWAKLPKDSI